MIIDCGTCALSPDRQHTIDRASSPAGDDVVSGDLPVGPSACDDCVVSVLLGSPGAEVSEIADEHEQAVGVLAQSGLIPPLRLVRAPRAS